MGELQDIPDKPLRRGYTTGACATAATKASLLALITQKKVTHVTITLPIGEVVTFPIIQSTNGDGWYRCSVIKDAGDDPDVTNKAQISAKVHLNSQGNIVFKGGEGVGMVTLPGLEIPVGEPAINPVPRQMMETVCKKLLSDHQLEKKGVTIEIAVKDGATLAKRTLNSRLGIIGGISILGTTGIVTPFSAASYIASIEQGIDVAVANGNTTLLINSGGRSEKALKKIFPKVTETTCIHYGNWIGETFEKINKTPEIRKVSMGIMLGKASKLAQGNTNTHSNKTTWNKEFIQKIAEEAGYSKETSEKVLALNMAGRLREIFTFAPDEPFYQRLLQECYKQCHNIAPNVTLNMYLISNDNQIIQHRK